VLRLARHTSGQVHRLRAFVDRPSAALVDAVEACTRTTADLHEYQADMRRRLKAAKGG